MKNQNLKNCKFLTRFVINGQDKSRQTHLYISDCLQASRKIINFFVFLQLMLGLK